MPLDEAYFLWLCSQVGLTEKIRNKVHTYWKLLRIFYDKEFSWSSRIPKDENRAIDGQDLRLQFLRETSAKTNDRNWLDMPASMLEVLVALSFKLAWDADGKQDEWFWLLVENLQLADCNDANPPDPMLVDEVLDQVINREYTRTGHGGLFPLNEAQSDQRKVELWYQAQAFLLERL